MKKEIELPFIAIGTNIINDYIRKIRDDNITRTADDEQSIINILSGLGGLIEFNLRILYQDFIRKNPQLKKEAEFYNISDLIDSLCDYIDNKNYTKLLKISNQIRNKLIHADYPALYKKQRWLIA